MSRSDLELRLVRWLDDGPHGAPTDVVEAALKEARAERQVRAVSLPWPRRRTVALPGTQAWGQAAIGLAAVLIAAVLLVFSFNNGPIPPASSPTPTLSPAPSASHSPTATASATPTSTATASPSPTPGPSLTSGPSPTITPQSSNTAPPPPPTGTGSGWQPSVLAGAGEFDAVAMAGDLQGAVHLAAAITLGVGVSRGIVYMTNSGGWHSERVTTAPRGQDDEGYDGEPDIALDADGTVWIAFTRYQCGGCAPTLSDGVFVTNNAGGSWSKPEQIGEAESYRPSIAVHDGVVHMAYASGQEPEQPSYPGFYATNANGRWSTFKLDDNASLPRLVVTSGGQALVAFGTSSGVTLKTFDGLDSQAFTQVPGPAPVDDLFLAIDPTDVLHLVWAEGSAWHEVINDPVASSWSAPANLDFGQLRPDAIAVDAGDTGVVASARSFDLDTGGAWFSIARLGPANADQLAQGEVGLTDVASFAGNFYLAYPYVGEGTAHGIWYTNSSTE